MGHPDVEINTEHDNDGMETVPCVATPPVTLHPISDFLIVLIHDDPAAAIITPTQRVDIPKVGTVIAAGPGYVSASGQLVPMPCTVGDAVLLQLGAGTDVSLGGTVYKFVPARDLFGVFAA